MAGLRERQKAKRNRAILEAASTLFKQNGYEAARIEAIAESAEVSVGTLYNYYAHGELKAEGSSITEGIGQGRITANLEGFEVDFPYQIPDVEWLPYLFGMIEDEGLVLGSSSGINVCGAVKLAKELGPGHTIVTALCDYGTRYQSKLFNADFLKEMEFDYPDWVEKIGGGPQG